MQKIERRFKKSTALFLYMYQSVEKTSEFLEDFSFRLVLGLKLSDSCHFRVPDVLLL